MDMNQYFQIRDAHDLICGGTSHNWSMLRATPVVKLSQSFRESAFQGVDMASQNV